MKKINKGPLLLIAALITAVFISGCNKSTSSTSSGGGAGNSSALTLKGAGQ